MDTSSLESQLLAITIAQLRLGKINMALVARELNMSEATLRRRLIAVGSSFSQLLDQARYELAQVYLADPTLQRDDIRTLLGFARAEDFDAAYASWKQRYAAAYAAEESPDGPEPRTARSVVNPGEPTSSRSQAVRHDALPQLCAAPCSQDKQPAKF